MEPSSRPDQRVRDGLIDGVLALGAGGLDRSAEHRTDDGWLADAWASAGSRVLVVDDGRVAVAADGQSLAWSSPDEVDQDADRFLLGVDGDGRAAFAVAGALPDDTRTGGLRELAAVLDDDEAGAVAHAVGLANWHASHPRCARCGEPTTVTDAGHVRRCPRDGSSHFPRTDPAIIVLVTDDDDRALLARHPAWPANRFSTLAGFVEPGESLEGALRREVHEEVGVRVGATRYVGSQPWPFPSSLMCGFTASAVTTDLHVDGVEITEAQWLARDDLDREVAAGRLHFPSSASIARRLIEGWYGGPLPA